MVEFSAAKTGGVGAFFYNIKSIIKSGFIVTETVLQIFGVAVLFSICAERFSVDWSKSIDDAEKRLLTTIEEKNRAAKNSNILAKLDGRVNETRK